MAQIISFSPTPMAVAAVLGLERPVKGLEFVVVCLIEGWPVAVLRVLTCPREAAILTKVSTTIWLQEVLGVDWEVGRRGRNSALKLSRQEFPGMTLREKFPYRISRKVGMRSSRARHTRGHHND